MQRIKDASSSSSSSSSRRPSDDRSGDTAAAAVVNVAYGSQSRSLASDDDDGGSSRLRAIGRQVNDWLSVVCDEVFGGNKTLFLMCVVLLVSLLMTGVSAVVGYELLSREMERVAEERRAEGRTAAHFGDRMACEPCYVFLEARSGYSAVQLTLFRVGMLLVQTIALDQCRYLACVYDPQFDVMRIMRDTRDTETGAAVGRGQRDGDVEYVPSMLVRKPLTQYQR